MAARFGDMLLEQRRRMGLSIQQVANTIKIRPQIIEFFETGNFASMPPRGYAQGMISSYARFLGLNPREVVNAYFDDLMAYERDTSQQGGRFQDAAGYVNSRSSVDNGRFLMVQGGRTTRYGQRPPQAGYITETGSSEEIRSQRDRFRSTPLPDDRALPAARGLSRDPRAGYGDGGYSGRSYRGVSAGRSRDGYSDADTTQVTPRLRSQSQPYGQRSSAPRSGQRGYQGRGELAPRPGRRGSQRQSSYRGRPDSGRGRIPQGNGRGSSNRGRGVGRASQ
ncbi:MAG: helix-turn-helix domain-containing protein, partial [Collinsella sp.]|nr:helix-turn-helix domain-containing protein [Collinsella sp.]